jgi:hypothetical protein
LAEIGLLLIRPKPIGFHAITRLVPWMTVLAIGLVATVIPLVSVTLASVPTEYSGLASAINNAVSRLAALMSIGTGGLISVGTASANGFAHVRDERRTIRPGRVVHRAVDYQSPCRVPTSAPRPSRCATLPGQQPLGRDRTIPSGVTVRAIDATRKQPTLASTALSIHASGHGCAYSPG